MDCVCAGGCGHWQSLLNPIPTQLALPSPKNKQPTPTPTHSLLAPKLPKDQSCPRIMPIVTKPQLRRALMVNDPNYSPASAGEEAVVSAAASNGALGPIYSPTASNNNTGAIGTGYNILLAGAATAAYFAWLDGVGWDGYDQ